MSLRLAAMFSLMLGAAAVRAWAGGGGEPPIESYRHVHPCRFDIRRFCSGVEPGRKRIQCLEAHASELSDACRKNLAERHERR